MCHQWKGKKIYTVYLSRYIMGTKFVGLNSLKKKKFIKIKDFIGAYFVCVCSFMQRWNFGGK